MKKIKAWGIFREITHSPQRESDDENILRLTAKNMENQGVKVSLFHSDDIKKDEINLPDQIFLMCETLPILDTLKTWENRGVVMINPIESVRNTYRHRSIELLSGFSEFFPESFLVKTSSSSIKNEIVPCWVKRGDVHATQEGDVAFSKNSEEIIQCLKRLNKREIKEAILQKHIAGDLIKFYGIGTEDKNWFHSFYHKNQKLRNHPFNMNTLKKYVRTGARALGLEIFGGDAIVESSGNIYIIDLNAWPSFALFRDEASMQIANYLISKIKKKFKSEIPNYECNSRKKVQATL